MSVVAGSMLATCAALTGMSIIHLGVQVTEHTNARHPVVAETTAEGKMAVDVTGPVQPDVNQFPVVWLDPERGFEDDPAVVPPGLSALPGPGEAVLSPGLIALGYTPSDFGFDASDVGTGHDGAIGDAGLASRSEGFIYARVAEGRSLGDSATFSSGFGGPGSQYPVETTLDVPSAGAAILGAVWLLILPALLLMTSAARAESQIRTERAGILWRLGIARRSIASLLALETLSLAAIGAVLGVVAWAVAVVPRTSLPGIGAALLPQSFDLPVPVMVAAVALILLNGALAALWVKRERNRPRIGTSVLWVLPFALCVGLMTVAGWAPQILGNDSFYDVGVAVLICAGVGATITLPMAIPALLGGMGAVGKLVRRPTAWLASRLVVSRRSTLARPAVMAAVLVYLAGATTAMIAALTVNPPVPVLPSADRAVWSVSWVDARDTDIETVTERATEAGAETLAVTPLPPPDPEDLVNGPVPLAEVTLPDCHAAQQFFGLDEQAVACTASDAIVSDLPYLVEFGSQGNRDGDPAQATSEMLLSVPTTWTEADAITLFSGLPAVNAWKLVGHNDFGTATYDWLAGGMIAATGLLAVGLIREIGDRVLVVVSERSHLLRAGLRSEEADWVYGLATMLPMFVALPLGYLAARVFAANGVSYLVTADSIDVVAIVALLVAGLTAVVIALTLWWQKRIDTP
jgi:hypothetical protein